MNAPTIKPLNVNQKLGEYTLALATVGYEERARFAAEQLGISAREKVALGFTAQQVLSYDLNRAWYDHAGYRVEHLDDKQYHGVVSREVDNAFADHKNEVSISMDISSLTRLRLAIF